MPYSLLKLGFPLSLQQTPACDQATYSPCYTNKLNTPNYTNPFGGITMSIILHTDTCFACGAPLDARRNGSLYCSGSCQSLLHKKKDQQAPALSIADYRVQLIESIKKGGYHPCKQHPINQIKREIADLEYQINRLLPVVAQL